MRQYNQGKYLRQFLILGKAHKITILKTVGWYLSFKQRWNKSVILFAKISQVFLIIRGGILSTPREVFLECNIMSSTFLLEYPCYSITKSRDLIYKSANPVIELLPEICAVRVRRTCFNASLFFC